MMLEILPLLRPAGHIPAMWLLLLQELLQYLPRPDSPKEDNEDEADLMIKPETPNGTVSKSPNKTEASSLSTGSPTSIMAGIPSYLFAEKLIPLLVDLFLHSPAVEKYSIFPEVVQGLCR